MDCGLHREKVVQKGEKNNNLDLNLACALVVKYTTILAKPILISATRGPSII